MASFVRFCSYALIGTIAFGYLWRFHFLPDLFSHFQLQYLVAAVSLLLWHTVRWSWRDTILMGALSVILVTRLIGSDLDAVFETADLQKEADVFFMNSEYLNTDTEPIAEAIAKSNTDIVALVELNSRLSEQIRTSGRYPYAYYYPDLVFSFGFFSREPILEQQTYFVGRYPIGVFRTTERTYYVVHPLPPFGTAAWERQREFFSTLSALIGRTPNFLVLGDFNSTIYSSLFRAYFEPYFHRSVYSWGTDGPLAIPIDHALSDTAIALRSGPKLSSDHVPLLVDTN